MQPALLKRLQSSLRSERIQAWRELLSQSETSHHVLRGDDRRKLAELLVHEEDEGVFRFGVISLLGCSCCDGSVPRRPVGKPRQGSVPRELSLHDWFWSEFLKPSAVFRATEQGYGRRDSDAVERLARRLSYKDFPLVNFQPLPLHEDGWRQITTEQAYDTICIVGRLSLYGDRAINLLQYPKARFRFRRQKPPPQYQKGEQLRAYYCLQEFDGERLVDEYFTEDVQRVWTDYGIVQRYPLFLGTRTITVILCAGASTLGTVGAAQWVARDLGSLQYSTTSVPTTLPKDIGPRSCLEALIRTTGDSTASIWRPSGSELVALYLDHYRWSMRDLHWQRMKRPEITLVMQGGKAVSLLIDGQEAKVHAGSQNFHLATRLVLLASQNTQGLVDIEELARAREIWGGHKQNPSKVRQRLHNFEQRVFQGALSIGHQIRLDAIIRIVEVAERVPGADHFHTLKEGQEDD
jgi:hypothetical protein